MLPQLPYPELINRDTGTKQMLHILSPEGPHKFWCGKERDPSKPVEWTHATDGECVVCEDLWRSLGSWWKREDSWL